MIGPILKYLGRLLLKYRREILLILSYIGTKVGKHFARKRLEKKIGREIQKELKRNVIILLVQLSILCATLFVSLHFKNPWPIRVAVWSVLAWSIYSIPVGLRRAYQLWHKYKKSKPILEFLRVSLMKSVVTPTIISLSIIIGILFLLKAGFMHSFGVESFRDLLRHLFSLREIVKI